MKKSGGMAKMALAKMALGGAAMKITIVKSSARKWRRGANGISGEKRGGAWRNGGGGVNVA